MKETNDAYLTRHFQRLTKNANEQIGVTPNNYSGESNLEVIQRAVYDNQLVKRMLVSVIGGIKKSETVFTYQSSLRLRDREAKFVGGQRPSQFIAIEIEPVVYGLTLEQTFLDLRNSYFKNNPGAANDALPISIVQNAWLQFIDENLPNIIDSLNLKGKTRTPQAVFTPAYLGFEEIVASATNSKKISAPRTPILAITNVGGKVALTVTATLGANYAIGDYITVVGLGDGTGNTATKLNNQIYNESVFDDFTTTNIQIADIDGDILVTNFDITINSVTIGAPVYTNAKMVCINQSNVVATLKSAWMNIPEAIRTSEDFSFWAHPYVIDTFAMSQAERLGNQLISPVGFTSDDMNMMMIKLERLPNMSPNTILGLRRKNAVYGVDDITDSNQYNLIDMSKVTNDLEFRLRMQMATTVKVPLTAEALIVR